MNRTLSSTAAVLVLTLFVALAIFATVHLAAGAASISSGTAVATASASGSASAPTGYTPAGRGNRGSEPGVSANGTSADDAQASGSSQLLVCPATGCSAPSCHAAR